MKCHHAMNILECAESGYAADEGRKRFAFPALCNVCATVIPKGSLTSTPSDSGPPHWRHWARRSDSITASPNCFWSSQRLTNKLMANPMLSFHRRPKKNGPRESREPLFSTGFLIGFFRPFQACLFPGKLQAITPQVRRRPLRLLLPSSTVSGDHGHRSPGP